MKYLKELHSSTYKRAAEKAKEYGQHNLSKKFSDWANKTNWDERKSQDIELKVRDEYSFDMYIDTINFSESGEIEYKKVVKANINDFTDDFGDGDIYSILWYYPEIKYGDNEDDMVLMRMDIGENGDIFDFVSNKNKFASRKDALKFIEFLHKMYKLQSKKIRNYKSRLNNLEGQIEAGSFNRFINDNFGSWEEFRSKIKLRKLYDRY